MKRGYILNISEGIILFNRESMNYAFYVGKKFVKLNGLIKKFFLEYYDQILLFYEFPHEKNLVNSIGLLFSDA